LPCCLLERAILAGDEFDAPPDARRRFAVARVGGALFLHPEPSEQRRRQPCAEAMSTAALIAVGVIEPLRRATA
jgi:hypothetical protein